MNPSVLSFSRFIGRFALLLAGFGGLYWVSLDNYLLFHSLVEIFSVVISFSIFILAWNSREFLENGYLLAIGISFLFVGALDTFHTFAFEGMNIFPGQTANHATQLWLAARFLQSFSMLAAGLLIRRRLKFFPVMVFYSIVFLLIMLSIFSWDIFPVAYIPNLGLTTFKMVSEFAIILAFLLSGVVLLQNRKDFNPTVRRMLLYFIAASVISEVAFTQYVSVYGPANAIGHLAKVTAVYFLYKAILETGFVKPYNILFRNLKQREEELRQSQAELEKRHLLLEQANVGLERELAERTRIEEALRSSESRLRKLVEANIIGVHYSSADGTISESNQAFLDMLGYSREDLLAENVRMNRITAPEYFELDQKAVQEAQERGACTPFEKEYVRSDGSRVPALVGFAQLDTHDEFIAFVVDLTHQKEAEAELASYARRLELSNTELEDFAFVASHDLQEPLRKIQTFGQRLYDRSNEQIDAESKDYLARMLNAATRMRSMINDLLALSRVTTQAQPFVPISLQQVAEEVLSDLEVQIENSGAQVTLNDLPNIEADPAQMRQLLQNLIGNALKFRRPDVLTLVRLNAERCATDEGPAIQLTVEDNGIGFEEIHTERIFQPFQRLHGRTEYEGSGVGLAICKKIVERHGGKITAHGVLNQGSTFIITLPAQHESA